MVIVVVEGPSGAGKTTWVRRHAGRHALLEELPDHDAVPDDPEAAARFWVERNVRRWEAVLERERRDGLVVVDTDPFKLHFTWTLYQEGMATRRQWELERDTSRAAFAGGRYGLADLVFVAAIDEATLRRRRDADATRTRRNFDRHVRLRDALLTWYRAIDALEPGRVVFELPDTGLAEHHLALGKRTVRSGAVLFDRLLGRLERG